MTGRVCATEWQMPQTTLVWRMTHGTQRSRPAWLPPTKFVVHVRAYKPYVVSAQFVQFVVVNLANKVFEHSHSDMNCDTLALT